MSNVIIAGGSVAGFAAALALADAGHQVTILERSGEQPPTTVDAAAEWQRPTVPQAVHSHAFASLGCNLLRERARDVYESLLAAGASEINLADYPPPTFADFARQPDDDNLRMILARRSTFELILRQRALARTGVRLTTGATVRGLMTGLGDPSRVTGVRLEDGQVLPGDVVIDATGRRTAADSWLAAAGLPVPVTTSESCKIVYYTRYYRQLSAGPAGPLNRGFGSGGLWDAYTAVLFLGDNRTFSVSVGVLPEDAELKSLRHEAAFEAVIRATPLLANWISPANAEPISPVYAMGGLDNAIRTPARGQARPGDSSLLATRSARLTRPTAAAFRSRCGRPSSSPTCSARALAPRRNRRPGGRDSPRGWFARGGRKRSPTTAAVPPCGRPRCGASRWTRRPVARSTSAWRLPRPLRTR